MNEHNEVMMSVMVDGLAMDLLVEVVEGYRQRCVDAGQPLPYIVYGDDHCCPKKLIQPNDPPHPIKVWWWDHLCPEIVTKLDPAHWLRRQDLDFTNKNHMFAGPYHAHMAAALFMVSSADFDNLVHAQQSRFPQLVWQWVGAMAPMGGCTTCQYALAPVNMLQLRTSIH